MLSVGRTTVYELIGSGQLTPVHIGRSVRLVVGQLEEFVDGLSGEVLPVRRVTRLLGERSVHRRGCFVASRRKNVSVDIRSHTDSGVAEQVADDFEGHSLCEEQRRSAVPELVRMPVTQAGTRLDDSTLVVLVGGSGVTGRLGEVAPDVRWIECGAANASEYEVNAQRLGRPLTGKPQTLDPLSLTMLAQTCGCDGG